MPRGDSRGGRTRARLREAAHRLFLQQGYQATSIEAILAEAGVSSKETLYRHYASKETLFADVLAHLTMEQPGFAEKVAALPQPIDLESLRDGLTRLSHEVAAMIAQPGYLPLVRMVLTESARFPQLGALFFSTVSQRGIGHVLDLLRAARQLGVIADVDLDAVTRAWLGGLVATVLIGLVFGGGQSQAETVAQVDAVVALIMRALRTERAEPAGAPTSRREESDLE